MTRLSELLGGEAARGGGPLQAPAPELGITLWSSRILGNRLGISNVAVAKIWKQWGIKPFRQERLLFSDSGGEGSTGAAAEHHSSATSMIISALTRRLRHQRCDGKEVELFAVYGPQTGEHGLLHGLA